MRIKVDRTVKEEARIFSNFNKHLLTFIFVMGLFWAIWYLLGPGSRSAIPIYLTAVWGLVLLIHYIQATLAIRKRNKLPLTKIDQPGEKF